MIAAFVDVISTIKMNGSAMRQAIQMKGNSNVHCVAKSSKQQAVSQTTRVTARLERIKTMLKWCNVNIAKNHLYQKFHSTYTYEMYFRDHMFANHVKKFTNSFPPTGDTSKKNIDCFYKTKCSE